MLAARGDTWHHCRRPQPVTPPPSCRVSKQPLSHRWSLSAYPRARIFHLHLVCSPRQQRGRELVSTSPAVWPSQGQSQALGTGLGPPSLWSWGSWVPPGVNASCECAQPCPREFFPWVGYTMCAALGRLGTARASTPGRSGPALGCPRLTATHHLAGAQELPAAWLPGPPGPGQ